MPPLQFIFKFLIVFNPILNGIVSLLLLFWLFTQYIKLQFISYVQFVSHNINNKSYNARNSPGIKFKSICKILSYQTNDFSSNIQFSSVIQSCPTLCNPTDCSMPGFPVHQQLPELTQKYLQGVSDAIQPSHPLSSPSPPAPNPSQHQSLFQWVNSSQEVAKVLEFQLQHQSFWLIFRTDFL